jgi:hypothetical protein
MARTRAFARVIGPFLVIAPGIIALRAPDMEALAVAFFENAALVWITGGLLVFGGLLIIAHHQYWSSVSAVLVSLFGWFLALRGVVLLASPQLIERAGQHTRRSQESGSGSRCLCLQGFGSHSPAGSPSRLAPAPQPDRAFVCRRLSQSTTVVSASVLVADSGKVG